MDAATKARKRAELKERLRIKCVWYYRDGCGGYCKQRPLNPPVHGHTHYRTMCLGKLGTFCVEPTQYIDEREVIK